MSEQEYTKDEALWWAINQMRRAAKVIQLVGEKASPDIYATGLNDCADTCEKVLDADTLARFRAEL